ncbi:MAG: 4-phosphoerythronate dehydrogenase [Bacteroidales bacterium]|nr:4-phosphoerythronate dehydrogenase [Bacteroidales bacterium]
MAKQKKLKIVADKHIPYLKGVLDSLADITYLPAREITSNAIREADALIIRTRTRCDRNFLTGTKVQFIVSATSGADHIDFDYCREQGITCKNAPGCNSSSVAQYLTAALLQIAEKERSSFNELTLGIIGVGHVGEKVRQVGEAFGMEVLLNDPPRKRHEKSHRYTSLENLLQQADIISLHVPLNKSGRDQTLALVDKDFLSKMKAGSWLINTSRGEVAKTSDLLEAPSDRKYILDVWENEPLLNRDLLSRTELGTSHIAGYSVNGKANATQTIVRELSRYFQLGLDDFIPQIPLPTENIIIPQGGNVFQQMQSTVFQSYSIAFDDQLLRKKPEDFEKHRKDYRRRWEFKNYTVQLNSGEQQLASWIGKMGFNLQFR